MSPPDDRASLEQMRSHAREAEAFLSNRVRADIPGDRMLTLAQIQLLQIIGEAARRISQPTRDLHPQIDWPQIIALRNRLIHGYDAVDYDVLWEVLTRDVPVLVRELDAILAAP